jgi:hypothetical protein
LETDTPTSFVFEAELIILVGVINIDLGLLKLEEALFNLLGRASYHQTWLILRPGV